MPSPSAQPPPSTAASSHPGVWQWYHFYFLLALFDVVVIVASLLLHHRTMGSYETALRELGWVDDQQRWVGDMRLALVALNAPGNDVFESRQVEDERQRARETLALLKAQMNHSQRFGLDLSRFAEPVDELVEAQRRIFEVFEGLDRQPVSSEERASRLAEAAISMAAMDRFTAEALEALSKTESMLVHQQDRLHEAYGLHLEQRALTEKIFLTLVVLILIGVLFYGRTLQRKHKQIEAQLRRAEVERRERLAAIGELASGVAHGIRNPLAAITSSAQLALEYGHFDDATRDRLQDVIISADRLNRRTTRLLQFAQDSRSGFERFNLVADVQQAVRELQPRLQDLGIAVETEFAEGELVVYGDRHSIVQSLIELLSNSMDNLARGGQIRVICRRDPQSSDHVQLSVVDNGPGIPEHLRSQVFELFFSSKADGGGVGLASVRRAVALHDGEVEIVPHDGPGAHVRMRLPLGR